MATGCVDSIFKAQCHSYDVIEIDNYVILSILQNLHFGEYDIFVYRFRLETNQT